MSDDDLSRVRDGLRARWAGCAHEHHAVLPSTNDRALAWARQGAPHGALVTADTQTAGRGRRGRTWHSPPGVSLYASLVVRPAAASSVAALGLAAGVGLREGLAELAPGLKWPNDLVVGDRKLAGILCEARWTDAGPELVVGFGLNVRRRDWPGQLRSRATSIEDLHGEAPGRAALLRRVLPALEAAVDDYLRGGFSAIRARYEAGCTILGRRIRLGDADDPDAAQAGVALRFDDDGALVLRPDGGGAPRRIEAADVWLAR